jgi:hypothetical protein
LPSIELPLLQKVTPYGTISDPTIPVLVPTLLGDLEYVFLIDTGADFSLAPRGLADEVGLDWTLLTEIGVGGVGPSGVRAGMGPWPLRIGPIDLTVRCLFTEGPPELFLIGRPDFLDRFALTIDTRLQRVVLTELE